MANTTNVERQQGVLWKRRDVFRNRWRPRWFSLQPNQGILTYYLLTGDAPTSVATPIRSNNNNSSHATRSIHGPYTDPPLRGGTPRDRTFSLDSLVSENTLDYDVVPRGTVYLLGARVAVNEHMSGDDFYAFTISSPRPSEPEICLAARTPEARDRWVRNLQRVCRVGERSIEESPTAPAEEVPPSLSIPTEPALNSHTEWQTVGAFSDSFENVPEALAQRIQTALSKYLPYCDKEYHDWKRIFRRPMLAAYERQEQGYKVIKSCALLDQPPKQILALLLDASRRREWEISVHRSECLRRYNPYTVLDYYVYQAVWPTSSRDFGVCMHWQLVTKGSETAVAVIALSCSEADELQPVTLEHVRAQLRLSLYLLQPVGEDQCQVIRLLSFDPKGNVSKQLANVIVTQQAGLLTQLGNYLQRTEPVPESRLLGELSNDCIIEHVVDHLNDGGIVRRLDFNGSSRDGSSRPDEVDEKLDSGVMILQSQAFILMLPILVYRAAFWLGLPAAFFWFLISAFASLRRAVVIHLGDTREMELRITGAMTCRFSVDLKGVLRFVSNKREERKELKRGKVDVSVVHLIVRAVAQALHKEPQLRQRRVQIPFLLIDEIVNPLDDSVQISVSENGGDIVTLRNVERKSVQGIADELDRAVLHPLDDPLGDCLVLATPDFDKSAMEVDVASNHDRVRIVAVIGGVRLERNALGQRGMGASGNPVPVLSVSLTVTGPQQTDLVTFRRFADEVQKILHFPEICEM